jgi:hypothetical protein
VTLGVKNTNYIIVTDGVREGDNVTLRDPTVKEPAKTDKPAGAGKEKKQ